MPFDDITGPSFQSPPLDSGGAPSLPQPDPDAPNDSAPPESTSTPAPVGSREASVSAPVETPNELTPASDATQDGDPVFPCPRCKKKFRSLTQQGKHTKRHSRLHRCPHDKCDKKFRDSTDLQRHVKNVHEASVREFPCIVQGCTRAFKGRRDNMYKHVRRKHPEHAHLVRQDAAH